jgi:diacylglycerol kinase (ATP)
LHNPGAGDEDHSAGELEELIVRAGHEVVSYSTDDRDWEQALECDPDLVAVAGGDGTVAAVLSSLATGTTQLATVLPLGSANNIARAFGLAERTSEELVHGWPNAARRRFRLGELRAPETHEIFVETVGGGLFAEAIQHAEQLETAEDDKVELGLQVLRKLVEEVPARAWRLSLDGTERTGEYIAVEAMVIGQTGPQVPLAPAADSEDRLVDVVLIGDDDRDSLVRYLDARLAGRRTANPRFEVQRCLRAELRPPARCPMRIDDGLWDVSSWIATGEAACVSVARSVELLTPPRAT